MKLVDANYIYQPKKKKKTRKLLLCEGLEEHDSTSEESHECGTEGLRKAA
jgi:hypothetical protein